MSRGHDGLWRVTEDELGDLTPVRARDLIIECFLRAQGHAARLTSPRHPEIHDRELRETMRVALRLRFDDLGLDFDDPTADCIGVIAAELARDAEIWGTPNHVVEHHIGELRRIERCLKGKQGSRRPTTLS